MKETLSVWLAAILRLLDLAPMHSLVATNLMLESGHKAGWQSGQGEIIGVTASSSGGGGYGWVVKIGAALALMAGLVFVAIKSTIAKSAASTLPVSSSSKSGYERV